MLKLNVRNETNRLSAVVLGIANSNGPTPTADEAYDPKSLEHIIAGTYPTETDMIHELSCLNDVLIRYGVEVYRPETIPNLNQIFTRDIGFVIDDYFVKSNILPDRANEWEAIRYIIDQINPDKLITAPEHIHIEGGDVILWRDYIFIGTYTGSDYSQINTARTNILGVEFIKEKFPNKTVIGLDLIKSKTDPQSNALHLDCCFQPVADNKAIIYPGGFRKKEDFQLLLELFGEENIFQITANEMYQMFSNVFSISPNVVVSEKRFTRLNTWLRQQNIIVEEIAYHEIGKQEGLLRCSTLPLIRK